MNIEYANDNNFENLVSNGTVLVDFFANWCGPCKMISPILEKIANEKDVKIVKVDVDACPVSASKNGITAIPTLVLYNDGQIVDKRQGFMTEDAILTWLNIG